MNRNSIVNFLSVALVLRLIFLFGDPSAPIIYGLPAIHDPNVQPLSLYATWQVFLGLLYAVTAIVEAPIQFTVGLLFKPTLTQQFLLSAIGPASVKQPPFSQLLGVVDYYSVLAIFMLNGVRIAIEKIEDMRVIQDVTAEKEEEYQKVLLQRNKDLFKMDVEFRSLTKETTELKDTIITDELTKVLNKRFFLGKIDEEFAKAKQGRGLLSVIMMDIDHFKRLNDTYGHMFGDIVLKAVAAEAKKATPADCYCCRFGGEEFSIILPGKSVEYAESVANHIREIIPMIRFREQADLKVTISQGICEVDFNTEAGQAVKDYNTLLEAADEQLYKSKFNGRNRCYSRQIGLNVEPKGSLE